MTTSLKFKAKSYELKSVSQAMRFALVGIRFQGPGSNRKGGEAASFKLSIAERAVTDGAGCR